MHIILFLIMATVLKSAVFGCPSACACIGTMVDCDNKGISAVPSGIPNSTTILCRVYRTVISRQKRVSFIKYDLAKAIGLNVLKRGVGYSGVGGFAENVMQAVKTQVKFYAKLREDISNLKIKEVHGVTVSVDSQVKSYELI